MSRMRPGEVVVCCPRCGVVSAVREVGCDERPSWPPLYCPRCGEPLPSPEPSVLRGTRRAPVTRALCLVRAQGVREKDLAVELDCDPTTLSRILRGKRMPTDEQLLKLSELLDVDPSLIW